MEKIISESKIDQVAKLIDKYDNIVTICHVSPDGDAVGSSLGLYHFLSALDKSVTVVVPDALPDNLCFLGGVKDILDFSKYPEFSAELIDKAELIFCLDFNALSRVGMTWLRLLQKLKLRK